MTVKELIEKLQDFDPEREVCFWDFHQGFRAPNPELDQAFDQGRFTYFGQPRRGANFENSRVVVRLW